MNKQSSIITVPAQKTPNISMGRICVSWEPLPITTPFSKEDSALFHHCLTQCDTSLHEAMKTLRFLKERYPGAPDILHAMANIAAQQNRPRASFRYIAENYRTNPDNLLARIQFGHMLAVKKRWREIPPLFDDVWDLTRLFPERSSFHISEYRGFCHLTAQVFLSRGHREAALELYYLLSRIAPNHPSTQSFEKKLRKARRPRRLIPRLLRKGQCDA